MKGFALGFALKQRRKATRKSPGRLNLSEVSMREQGHRIHINFNRVSKIVQHFKMPTFNTSEKEW